MRLIALVSCLVCSVLGGSVAVAQTLRSVSIPIHNFFPRGEPMGAYEDDLVFSIGLRPVPPFDQELPLTPIPNEIFDNVRFNILDVGKTVKLVTSDDPDFAGFVAMLTNGTADEALLSARTFAKGENSGAPEGVDQHVGATSETGLFSINGSPDLHGYQIDSISERLDSLTITDNVVPLPSAPNIIGRQFDGQVTLTIEGSATPEPGSATMLAMAACGWLSRHRRRLPPRAGKF
jgi:hypothetical protein